MDRDPRSIHIDFVVSVVTGQGQRQGMGPRETVDDLVVRSWQRSLINYRLSPTHAAKTGVVTNGSLKDYREPMHGFLVIARQGMALLHARVRDAGCMVMFSDLNGISIDTLCEPATCRQWEKLGLLPGACWSEGEEGTNAVGTCIAEQAALTIHKDDHFCATNIDFSCSASPVFGADGRMIGVLDATALGAPDDRRTQAVIMELVRSHATLIENAHFLNQYRDHWVLNFNRVRQFLDVQAEHLLALDRRGRIVAANRSALAELHAGSGRPLLNAAIDEVFDIRTEDIPRLASEARLTLMLHTMLSNAAYFGTFRPPRKAPARSMAPTARPAVPACLQVLAGTDAQMNRNIGKLVRVVDRDIPILLTGETGTGKEMLARAIHRSSARASRPFVAINCAAIPEALIESELFGHRAGAFTGAAPKGHRGCIEQASGGTLFLDEIGDMPRHLQTRLLRVMAEGEIVPLGAEAPVKVDLHVVCATHCHLPKLVAEGSFREDLYYRLAGLTVEMPALRQRSDREALIGDLLRQEAQALGVEVELDAEAQAALLAHPWPGNIRQLRSVLRLALSLRQGDVIALADLPGDIVAVPAPSALSATSDLMPAPAEFGAATPAVSPPMGLRLRAERDVLVAALRDHQWQPSRAAVALQMSRATLYRKMKRLQIVPLNRAA